MTRYTRKKKGIQKARGWRSKRSSKGKRYSVNYSVPGKIVVRYYKNGKIVQKEHRKKR